MHEDAGQRRRRRLLLLMPRRGNAGRAGGSLLADEGVSDAEVNQDDAYLDACGPNLRCTVCVEDLARRVLREQPLDHAAFSIGGDPDNDLWLKHDRILPRHLLLVRLPGGVFFVTFSDDAEVRGAKGLVKSGWWEPGMVLRVGAFRLRLNGLRKAPPPSDPLAVSPALEAELPRLELRFLGSTSPKRPWPVTRPLTFIGRSPLCKIRLDHERILPLEAALVRTAGRLWLINLGEPGRTLVNEEPMESVTLEVGDRLKVGEFRIEVQSAGEWPAQTVRVPDAAAPSAPETSQLEGLLRQFAVQQQKILETQQKALEDLERLAGETTDPVQMKSVLEQLRQSYETIGDDHSRMQAALERKLRHES